MVYLKSLLFNFLIVFFVNHLIPGIEATSRKLPHIGGDLIFAIALGILNSLIYPTLKLFKQEPTGLRIALICLILNFAAYAVVKITPAGVEVSSVEGYVLAGAIVSISSFLINFFEAKHGIKKMEMPQ